MAPGITNLGSKWRGVSGQLYTKPRSTLRDTTLLIIAYETGGFPQSVLGQNGL
jgi:hypothetical protein